MNIPFLLDKNGYRTGYASFKTTYDLYITPYRDVYPIIALRKGKISLSHLSAELEVNDCLFLGKNELFRLSSEETYEFHYIQFTDAFYCRKGDDRFFLDKCSFFVNTLSLNLLQLEPQYLQYVTSYLLHFKQLSTQEPNEINSIWVHNTIERVLFALSMNIEKFHSINRVKLPLH